MTQIGAIVRIVAGVALIGLGIAVLVTVNVLAGLGLLLIGIVVSLENGMWILATRAEDQDHLS